MSIRLEVALINKITSKVLKESWFSSKRTPDEQIAYHILAKLEKERPEIQYVFLDRSFGWGSFNQIEGNECDQYKIAFNANKNPITKATKGNLLGGDLSAIKVYNSIYKRDGNLYQRFARGYSISLAGGGSLQIPNSLAKKIFEKVKDQYGDIRVFKTKRRLDKGGDDESDVFNQLDE